MKFDLVIAGVGGQGNLLASQVVAKCAIDAGYSVVNTETKGAAQRGGSVLSHVRISDKEIYSPLVPQGQADLLLGFEPLEALRYINILNTTGKFVVNTAQVPTILANLKVDQYPTLEEMKAEIGNRQLTGYFIDATQTAKQLGDVLLTNVIMLGAFTQIADIISPDAILKKLLSMVKVNYHEADITAFNRGQELLSAQKK